MTTPENPFSGSELPGAQAEPPGGSPGSDARNDLVHTGIAEAFPSWGMLDILIIVGITIGAVFFSTLVTAMVASAMPVYRDATFNHLLTDARVLVPAQTIAYVIVLFFVYRVVAGYRHISFAEAIHWRWPSRSWPVYLAGGVVIALTLLVVQRYLPVPKQLPIQQMFSTPAAAWMLVFLGVAIAPVMEEIFFRGLLFPVLARHLRTAVAVVLTGLSFALIHASQLGSAWAPVLVLTIVGILLTLVRWYARSVAAAVLVHIGYNATLFGLLYQATEGFRHLERVAG